MGMTRSLRVQGHEIYGPWFNRVDPTVYNNVQLTRPDGTGEVVTGIASSGQGIAEEFLTDDRALGFKGLPHCSDLAALAESPCPASTASRAM